MLRILVGILLLFLHFHSFGQHQNIPINFLIGKKIEQKILTNKSNAHSAVRPYVQTFLNKDDYTLVFEDTNLYYYDFTQKLFKENLLNIEQEDVHLVCDPLMNVAGGFAFQDSVSNSAKINTRGIRVAGDITEKFSFETRFYETQVYYPSYLDSIADSRGVAFGLGRDKPFKDNGHDVGMSSGYISYTPNDWVNVQFGQDKHFLGNGYRSLLLSDNAANYPFFSFQLSLLKGKLLYKNVNAWLQSIERIPVSSTPEALFKEKRASFRYLSFKPNHLIEFGLFEGTIYKTYEDTIGEISVPSDFYIPLIGASTIFGANRPEQKQILGINLNVNPVKSALLYGQFIIDDFSRKGFQIGAKWSDVAGIKDSWLMIEYNNVDAYTYTMSTNNVLQNYSQVNQELAHPLGASFNELILMAYYEKDRWFTCGKFLVANKTGYGGYNSGQNIFLPDDEIMMMIAPKKTHWSYYGLETGYVFNVKTKLQVFGSIYNRSEKNNEWFWNVGLRTRLNNLYHDI